ncbi:DUF3798 domain-containing protein [Serpentinicella alkaliphila]|uniref:Uncharacterized protein DUF3798 n=1 Tax=Serpentinicella alkaliphila TaxID=1734049 RepID=A0A4R2UCU5_9FIRM|nr:DUF3798 domain-containing protein [Serpentinicella alkaliphila]QUH26869.1 DUF3798 domain-containing protein [Serpentinicella alkaliphila]TCQ08099.1 uncharacterized protein DUF3798 [Serpentinicella alkaliphila]
MFRKLLALMMICLMVLGLAACGQKPATTPQNASEGFKIGLVTSTVSQNEEEFRAAEEMIARYGVDMIKHVTYPDRFMQEQETTIAQIVALASDPEVKAIVVVQAVPGTAAAIDTIKETRDDIVFVVGNPHEDPDLIAARADVVLDVDQLTRGLTIVENAKKMGAETFVHYSFPRHMSYELLSQRRDILKQTAENLGLKFVEVNAPDPTGDAGIPGTQQFILEDIPRQVATYGKNTVFFGTNCAMMEPMIRTILSEGAIFTEQCCPSPYHAYPGALGIEIPADKAGDVAYMLQQIDSKVDENGNSGRMATWKAPASMAMVRAGVEYGIAYAKGEIEKFDKAAITKYLSQETGGDVVVTELDGLSNFLMFVAELEVF